MAMPTSSGKKARRHGGFSDPAALGRKGGLVGGKKGVRKPPQLLVDMRVALKTRKGESVENETIRALVEFKEADMGRFMAQMAGLERMYFQGRKSVEKKKKDTEAEAARDGDVEKVLLDVLAAAGLKPPADWVPASREAAPEKAEGPLHI
jgi:hypothetical protein